MSDIGSCEIIYTISNDYCTDEMIFELELLNDPDATFIYPNVIYCVDDAVSLDWQPIAMMAGTYTYTGEGYLDLNSSSGWINWETSDLGGYEVIHAVSNSCATVSESTNITLESCLTALNIQLQVFLQGPYQPDLGQMSTTLRDLELLPLNQPYAGAPWNYLGGESVSTMYDIPINAVDWVLIELRSGTDESLIVSQKAGILLNDRQVVEVDGNPFTMNQLNPNQAYYIIVRQQQT